MSTLIKGTVTLTGGATHGFVIGPRERIKAERALGIKPSDMKDGKVGEAYLSYLIFEALKREGELADVDYDTFIDKHIADYEVASDPESQTLPAE